MKITRMQLLNLISETVDPDESGTLSADELRSIADNLDSVSSTSGPTKLRVFDFDDTLAHTYEKVKLSTPSGDRMLTSDEYAVYEPEEGEFYDTDAFDEFSRVDTETAQPIDAITKILYDAAKAPNPESRVLLILTARTQEAETTARDFLTQTFARILVEEGFDSRRAGAQAAELVSKVAFTGVGSSDPQAKVDVIDDYLSRYSAINDVLFFDDSFKNTAAVKDYLRTNQQVTRSDVGRPEMVDGALKIPRVQESIDAKLCSKDLLFHIEQRVGVNQNIHRPGSKSFFRLFREARTLQSLGLYESVNELEHELLESDIGEFGYYEGQLVPLDYPQLIDDVIDEAKYKGRKVKLGKKGARRLKGGKAQVYVRDPKTKKIKKVTFGSSMPDAMRDTKEHGKRRKSYGDRHQCAKKKDKTKPGYWSCRLTKLFGRNIAGWW